MSLHFLDTNVVIDCLRGTTPLIRESMKEFGPGQIKIPSMVKAELLYGAQKSNHPKKSETMVQQFLTYFEIVPFDDASAQVYGEIRNELESEGKGIGFNDTIIAATTIAHSGVLVTRNRREFERIRLLRMECWAEYEISDSGEVSFRP